jgi:hypothetical protein
MNTASETLKVAQAFGIEVTPNGDKLHIKAPAGVMTLELKRALKEHKEDILFLLSLPEPAKPGEEVEQLRRKIGKMVRDTTHISKQAVYF